MPDSEGHHSKPSERRAGIHHAFTASVRPHAPQRKPAIGEAGENMLSIGRFDGHTGGCLGQLYCVPAGRSHAPDREARMGQTIREINPPPVMRPTGQEIHPGSGLQFPRDPLANPASLSLRAAPCPFRRANDASGHPDRVLSPTAPRLELPPHCQSC
jgi:hypothetical protein